MNSARPADEGNARWRTKKTRRQTPAGPVGASGAGRSTGRGGSTVLLVRPLTHGLDLAAEVVQGLVQLPVLERLLLLRLRDHVQVAQVLAQLVPLLPGDLDLEPVVRLHPPVGDRRV